MKYRSILYIIAMILFAVFLVNEPVQAMETTLKVNLPSFRVTLNGTEVNNSFCKYPLIVYNDITYFPMTYAGCRFLGLETKWNQTAGLEINKTNVSYPFDEYRTNDINLNRYTASIPGFKIMLNGRTIDNSRTPFPMLLFREVTYFPLAWEFVVDELQWNYLFDPINGLVITSQNLSPKSLNLIDYLQSESGFGNFIIHGEYIYYEGERGAVYQAPLNNLNHHVNIFQLPKDTYFPERENVYVKPFFIQQGEKVILSYSISGTKGLTYEVTINANGTIMKPVEVGPFIAPEVSEEGVLLYKTGNVIETETHRYLISSNINITNDPHRIYKWNKATGEVTLVNEKVADAFKYRNEKIFFVSDDRRLYSLSLIDDSVQLECNGPIYQGKYEVLGDSIYFFSDTDRKVYKSEEDSPLNYGESGETLQRLGDFAVITFDTTLNHSYKSIVFNINGETVYLLPRKMSLASADSNRIAYFDEFEGKVFLIAVERR